MLFFSPDGAITRRVLVWRRATYFIVAQTGSSAPQQPFERFLPEDENVKWVCVRSPEGQALLAAAAL